MLCHLALGRRHLQWHRRLLELGIPTAAATDNIPYDPFFTLWVMTARQERTTGQVLGQGQCVDVESALRLLTVAGARLTFDEDKKGPLIAGYLADMAVLSESPLACGAAGLRGIRADCSSVGGRIVHARA